MQREKEGQRDLPNGFYKPELDQSEAWSQDPLLVLALECRGPRT